MLRLISLAIIAGLFFAESNQLVVSSLAIQHLTAKRLPCYSTTPIYCWTDWFDRDDPSGTGDWETLDNLRNEKPGKICSDPLHIEAQTLSGQSVAAAGDVIYKYDTTSGFVCRKEDQTSNKCNDYRVRFSCHPQFCGGVCWTKWFDRDNPSGSADWEALSNLRAENPDAICLKPLYIEAVTTDTLAPAVSTGQTFSFYDPIKGFACLNRDQPHGYCLDYKVRFGCPCKR